MNWNPAQRAMLEAMGYTLHRFVAGGAAPGRSGPEGPSADHARLLLALKRAAGGRDLDGVPLPSLDALRGDAAAKRALWPRLRALRRR